MVPYQSFTGDVPWTMTQNQRGPTCALTAISVAYRILTGWTIFATKGQYRDFSGQLKNIKLEKGQENAYVLRKAAKDADYTAAGEIVNADDLVELVDLTGDTTAVVRPITGPKLGDNFLEALRTDIDLEWVPIVLFYLDIRPVKIQRSGAWQHWVTVFAVAKEDQSGWHQLHPVVSHGKKPLLLTQKPKSAKDVVIWTWGKAYVVNGDELGSASALSLDWVSSGKQRRWLKEPTLETAGKLKWIELPPGHTDYQAPLKEGQEERFTTRQPTRPLDAAGYVVVATG